MRKFLSLFLIFALCLSGVNVFSAEEKVNISIGKSASASSTFSSQFTPSKAVDGVQNTLWAWGWKELDGWWQVDLDGDFFIDEIEIVGRTEYDVADVRRNMEIRASNDQDFNDYVVLNNMGSSSFPHEGTYSAKSANNSSTFRYVRVVKTVRDEDFNIAEFNVFGRKYVDKNAPIADLQGEKYQNVLEFLNKLEIVTVNDNNEFLPNSFVTKAEASIFIANMLKLSNNGVENQKSYFVDVKEDNVAKSAINTLCDLEIISRVGDCFNPNEAITLNQAVKMMVVALGYDDIATAKGAYPYGYLTIAEEHKLLSELSSKKDGAMMKKDFSLLLFNTLNAPLFNQVSFGNVSKYSIDSGVTILTKYYKIYKFKGIVEQTEKTALNKVEKLGKGLIKIRGDIYNIDNQIGINLLGYSVEGYAKEVDGEYDIISVYEMMNRNNVIKLGGRDVSSLNKNVVGYTSGDGKTDKITLSETVDFILNGVSFAGWSEEYLTYELSNLVFIDNDNDNEYDLIKAKIWESHLSGATDLTREIITNRDGTFTLNYDGKILDVIKDGKSGLVEQIVPDTVLSVMGDKMVLKNGRFIVDSKNSQNFTVDISQRVISGMVTSVGTDIVNGVEKEVVYFGDRYYYVNSKYTKDEISNITIGEEAKFYVDLGYNIVYRETIVKGRSENYGLMLGAEKAGMYSGKIKILTTENVVEILELASGATVNGGAVTTDNFKSLLVTDKSGTFDVASGKQIVKYEMIGNKIKRLYTGKKYTEPHSEKELLITGSYYRRCYRNSTKSFSLGENFTDPLAYGTTGVITENTKILFIPKDGKDDLGYKWVTNNDIPDGDWPFSTLYGGNEVGECSVVVYKEPSESGDLGRGIRNSIITKITKTINADGEEVERIYYYQEGIERSVINISETKFKIGNIIQFRKNYKGELLVGKVNFDVTNNIPSSYTSNRIDTDLANQIIFGKVLHKRGDLVKLQVGPDPSLPDGEQIYHIPSPVVYIFDIAENKVTIGNVSDVQKGDEIFMVLRNMFAEDLVIIR